jgi:hypothetical protein
LKGFKSSNPGAKNGNAEMDVTDKELVLYIDWWKQRNRDAEEEARLQEEANLVKIFTVNDNLRY